MTIEQTAGDPPINIFGNNGTNPYWHSYVPQAQYTWPTYQPPQPNKNDVAIEAIKSLSGVMESGELCIDDYIDTLKQIMWSLKESNGN